MPQPASSSSSVASCQSQSQSESVRESESALSCARGVPVPPAVISQQSVPSAIASTHSLQSDQTQSVSQCTVPRACRHKHACPAAAVVVSSARAPCGVGLGAATGASWLSNSEKQSTVASPHPHRTEQGCIHDMTRVVSARTETTEPQAHLASRWFRGIALHYIKDCTADMNMMSSAFYTSRLLGRRCPPREHYKNSCDGKRRVTLSACHPLHTPRTAGNWADSIHRVPTGLALALAWPLPASPVCCGVPQPPVR